MDKPDLKHYSFQVAISTLFILITIILSSVLTLLNYNKTSAIILSSANQLYAQITQELVLDFNGTYEPMAGMLQLLSHSPVTRSRTLEERLQYLGSFKSVLESNTSYFAVSIAFPDGNFLTTSLLNSRLKREYYNAPNEASLLVLHVNNDSRGKKKLTTLFYDDNDHEISRRTEDTVFDILQSPWYIQANDIPHATKPYLFSHIKMVGLTAMLKSPEPGVVIAIQVTLDDLSSTIAKYQITENSEVVLINAEGEIYAYKNPDKVIVEEADKQLKLANIKQLNSDVLSYIGSKFDLVEQHFDFEFNHTRWIGSSKVIARPGGVDLYAVMVSPVDELLKDATAIKWQSLVAAMGIILLVIPIIWLVSRKISTPLQNLAIEARKITRFNFDESRINHTFIEEVDDLENAMEMMKSTINKFINLINSLAGEQDLDALLKSITLQTMQISKANGAVAYLLDETDNLMKPGIMFDHKNQAVSTDSLPELTIDDSNELLGDIGSKSSKIIHLNKTTSSKLNGLLDISNASDLYVLIIPLCNRNNETIGLLCINYLGNQTGDNNANEASIAFVEALSGFAAVTLESRQMLNMQEALLNSFIKLIAGAIDSKSPYTGGHCQRVPEITFLLAQAACESNDDIFKNFDLDNKQWQALEIACWLHDCGKVTTPEYVVDKATKLETIYDRIHEVRMRFEVLKRDAEIRYWQKHSEGGDIVLLKQTLKEELQALDEDFAFIAECNEGGEFMAEERIERLQKISERIWLRTLDDRIGISWEELNRKNKTHKATLPVEERLLSDKADHIISRSENERMPEDNPWNFKLITPEHKYNRGELYNLAIKKGTLSEEERFKINEHMVQTIIMLNKLPYPRHLKEVPDIAGCHHETLDGKGYPKRLTKEQTPMTGRMMAIADIFEALTASDRPYKKAKTLSEAIRILNFMKKDNHIDADLFELFLKSGAYLKYAKKFLNEEQIDEVDITEYISP